VEDAADRQGPPISEGERKEEKERRLARLGEEVSRLGQLGRAGEKKERGKRKIEWAGPKEKKRAKKEMHSNAFEFEFEI
jgi:hypothetical protein